MQRDLYLNRGVAWIAVTRILFSIGFLWVSPIHAATVDYGRDYLLPTNINGGFIYQPSTTEANRSAAKTSASTSYQAFDGSTFQLQENRGRFVNVLLPPSYDNGAFFTADHIRELVDRLDILYALYSDLLKAEPAGNGLLTIAFIPQTCGMGCGLVGAKGFEVLSVPANYEAIIQELDSGRLESVLLHEMAHNFDLHSAYLHYLPDHAHAWTDMFEFFAPFRYSREGSHGEAPDDAYNSPVGSVWKKYITDEGTNWQQCVIDGACDDIGLSANNLWAMLYYRIEAVHGVEAILASFEFLRDYASVLPPPNTEQQKEGLRILSLAMGAGTNIACYMDTLKWPIPANIRTELELSFGAGSEHCADLDDDGFDAVGGDCDDHDASRNILMSEIDGNGIDEDCDELVDESHLIEADAGPASDNFVDAVNTTIPFEVEGSSANPDDWDTFNFNLPASGRTKVTLCASGGFKGWLVALQANGSYLQGANGYSYQSMAGCTSNTFDFGGPGNAGLAVIADQSEGDYSLVVAEAAALLPDHSAFVQVSANPAGGMNLQINDEDGLFPSLGTDEIEIWVSGTGVQIIKPFDSDLSVVLNGSTAPGLQNGEIYQVRIRPRANGLPLAGFSGGQLFRYELTPTSLPSIDHRFNGAWFDAAHDGEGFIVEILEDGRALVYWFTYQQDGRQRWMVGIGEIDANTIRIAELLDSRGGRFGADFDPSEVILEAVGSLSISFLDCSSALVNYSVDGNSAHQDTTRLTHIYGYGCDDQTIPVENSFSGSWFDPTHDGEGFIIEQISATTALVFWFTYDDTGQQSWMFNTGEINNGTIYIPELLQPKGGHFGRSFDPQTVTNHQWGDLSLELDCTGGSASYTTQSESHSNGSQSLVPLTHLAGTSCQN